MTKEEARLTLQENYGLLTFEHPGRITEALKVALETLSKSNLPSNFDNAAELSANDAMMKRQFPSVVYNTGLKCFDHSDLMKQFKAGAEWMAGQGQTFEAHVDNGCAFASGVKLPFILWDTYEDGDVLKVQIRKK